MSSNLNFSPFDPNEKLSWWETRPCWLWLEWYSYLFRIPNYKDGDRPLGRGGESKWLDYCRRIYCRYKGHPNGQVYYNPNGYEPDYHCKDCGDEI